jgi:sugar/nucleoside kinase (ribokinase family)
VTRFLACGTVYLTHLLSVPPSLVDPLHAAPSDSQSQATTTTTIITTTSVRAKQVTTERGGSAVNILSLLAQFNTSKRSAVECALVAPLGSDAAGRALMHELELEGIRTRFCKVHPAGVPAAFVLRSGECATSCKIML